MDKRRHDEPIAAGTRGKGAQRKARLADALRHNLQRRKAQDRARRVEGRDDTKPSSDS